MKLRKKQRGGAFKGFTPEMLASAQQSVQKSKRSTGLASLDKVMPTEEQMKIIQAQKIVDDKRKITARRDTIRASNASEGLKDQVKNSAVGDKMRLFPDDPNSFIDEYLNPLKMIGSMADNIGHTVTNPDATTKDYAFALGTPLLTGALSGIGANNTTQFVNHLTNPLAGLGKRAANSPLPNLTIGMIKNRDFKGLVDLYGIAAAAEIAPIVKRIPVLNKKYKDLAYKYASQSGGSPSLSFRDMKRIRTAKGQSIIPYNGDNSMFEVVEGVPDLEKRNLLKEYIYGNQPGFKKSSEVTQGLERYQKKYGDMNVYEMNSVIGNGNPLTNDNINYFNILYTENVKKAKLTGRSDNLLFGEGTNQNPIRPTDDIAGHIGWIEHNNVTNKPELVSQDIWKFTPDDYVNRWGKTGRQKEMLAKDYIKYKQAVLMDNAGKPFITMSRNPIHVNFDKKQKGGSISKMGYRDDSPYRGRKSITIDTPEGLIDMSNTGIPLMAEDETGYTKILEPYSGMHQFSGSKVKEMPLLAKGGITKNKAKEMLKDGTAHGKKLTAKQKKYFGWIAGGKKQQGGKLAELISQSPQQQERGLSKKQIFDFIFNDEDEPTAVAQPTAEVEEETLKTNVNEEDYEPEDYFSEDPIVRNRYRERRAREDEQQITAYEGTQYQSGDKGEYAYNYLISKGLPKHAAAGIIGNFVQESGNFREDVISGKTKGDSGLATGIAQWHPDRWSQAVNYSKQQGKNPYTLEAQLDWALYESGKRGDLQKTINTSTPEEAAYTFAKHYERPKIIDPNRARYARAHYKQWGGEIYEDLFK